MEVLGAVPARNLVTEMGGWPLMNTSQNMDFITMLLKLAEINVMPLFDVTVDKDYLNSSQYIAWVHKHWFLAHNVELKRLEIMKLII